MSIENPDIIACIAQVVGVGSPLRYSKGFGFTGIPVWDTDHFVLTLDEGFVIADGSFHCQGINGYAATFAVTRPTATTLFVYPFGANGESFRCDFSILGLRFPASAQAVSNGTPITPSNQSGIVSGSKLVALGRFAAADGAAVGTLFPAAGFSCAHAGAGDYNVTIPALSAETAGRVFVTMESTTLGDVASVSIDSTTNISVLTAAFNAGGPSFDAADREFSIAVYDAGA